jgi:integrase
MKIGSLHTPQYAGKQFYGGLGSRKKPIPFPVTIDEILPLSSYYPEPYQTLFLATYIYGARIGETIALNKRDLQRTQDDDGRAVLVASILTEKNRINPLRRIPAILGGDNLTPFQTEEAKITEHVHAYSEYAKDKLFPNVTRQTAFNHFSEQSINVTALVTQPEPEIVELNDFKLHPHYLRHVRLTHLREEYNYDTADLMLYAGWTDTRPAAVYIQLDWRHLAAQMKRRVTR